MTLVITTASRSGITVVGDRAVSRSGGGQVTKVLEEPATKIFFAEAANISLAFWGRTQLASGSLSEFAESFLSKELTRRRELRKVARLLAHQLYQQLEPLHTGSTTWSDLRRGVHVGGFVDGIPHVWHVHTGTQEHGKRPEAHQDFPRIHGGGSRKYGAFLESGGYARLFNGFSELYDVVSSIGEDLRNRLESEFEVTIPAPNLRGQLAYERGFARLCADMLLAADCTPQISTEFDVIAFDANGRLSEADLRSTGGSLRTRLKGSPRADVTASFSTIIGGPLVRAFDTSSLKKRKH